MLDYNFYKDEYGGELTEQEFKRSKLHAEALVNLHTFNRLKDISQIPNEVKYCICELIDYSNYQTDNYGKDIVSETVGTHSKTYAQNNRVTNSREPSKEFNIVRKWLGSTGLMFRGVSNVYK